MGTDLGDPLWVGSGLVLQLAADTDHQKMTSVAVADARLIAGLRMVTKHWRAD